MNLTLFFIKQKQKNLKEATSQRDPLFPLHKSPRIGAYTGK